MKSFSGRPRPTEAACCEGAAARTRPGPGGARFAGEAGTGSTRPPRLLFAPNPRCRADAGIAWGQAGGLAVIGAGCQGCANRGALGVSRGLLPLVLSTGPPPDPTNTGHTPARSSRQEGCSSPPRHARRGWGPGECPGGRPCACRPWLASRGYSPRAPLPGARNPGAASPSCSSPSTWTSRRSSRRARWAQTPRPARLQRTALLSQPATAQTGGLCCLRGR
jgi:hypothetical protein